MSKPSEILFESVKAIHLRSVKPAGEYRPVHVTGPTCHASVSWFVGNRMPSFRINLDGRNIVKSMFRELAPVFAVKGWDLDAGINLSNVMYHYAEGVNADGRRQYWGSEEERKHAETKNGVAAKESFAKNHPDIPLHVIDEIYTNRYSRTPLSMEMLERERIHWKDAHGDKHSLAVVRNNEALALTLGIPLDEARSIPPGMDDEYFTSLIDGLMPARMAKVQAAWNCLKSFPEGCLPNDWREALPDKFKLDLKKGMTIYIDGMTEPAYAFTDGETAYLGFKPVFHSVVDGTYPTNYEGGYTDVPAHIMDLADKLDANEFAMNNQESQAMRPGM